MDFHETGCEPDHLFTCIQRPFFKHLCLISSLFMIRHDNITDELLCVVEGNSVLSFQGYRLNFPWIWYDEIALLVHGVLWLIAAYFIYQDLVQAI